MDNLLSHFLSQRIALIIQDLRDKDGHYANVAQSLQEVSARLSELLKTEATSLEVSEGDLDIIAE